MDDYSQPGDFDDDDPGPAPSASETRLAGLRAAVERGLIDIKEGRIADPDLELDRIEAMLDELEAAKRDAPPA